MKPCISQVTTLSAGFAEDIAAYADAGWHAVEIWLTKLEEHLKQHSLSETRTLLADAGILAAAASYQGGLLQSMGDSRQAHLDHFRRRLDICQALSIPTIIVAADFHEAVATADMDSIEASLREAAQWAAGASMAIALEFLAPSRFCNNLQTAMTLVQSVGEPNVGVNLDVFHYWVGPSKSEDLALLSSEKLTHVQVCDLAGGLREFAADADRILPGDGELELDGVRRRLEDIGYNGWVSLEAMNPVLWRMKPAQVAATALQALERWLGGSQAAP
jgi:2-keto-myo-inositol isomerase